VKVRLLKSLNIPGLIFFAFLMMSLQSTLFSNVTLSFFQPDLVLFIVLWVAMKRDFYEGGILTLVLGYCVELNSAAPAGLFMTNYMFIFLLTRFFYKNFQVVNKRTLVMVGIGAGILSRLDILFILYLLNKADNQWFHTLQLLAPTAIIHGALIGVVFKLLHRFDFFTFKNPEAEHRYERDFYLDEEPV
jgi:cell shape-determining protein MreD